MISYNSNRIPVPNASAASPEQLGHMHTCVYGQSAQDITSMRVSDLKRATLFEGVQNERKGVETAEKEQIQAALTVTYYLEDF